MPGEKRRRQRANREKQRDIRRKGDRQMESKREIVRELQK
jgi:hypothetical protein